MGIYSIKPYFQKVLNPISNYFIKIKLHPTIINLLALVISIAMGFVFFIAKYNTLFFILIPIFAFFRIALNALDGMVARGLNVSSKKGEVYNEFLDRLSDAIIFTCLSYSFVNTITIDIKFFTSNINSSICLILGFITIIAILLNSYLGILGKSAGTERIYTGLIGKADRMFYLGLTSIIAIFIHLEIVWIVFFIIVLIGTIISIFQRFNLIIKLLDKK